MWENFSDYITLNIWPPKSLDYHLWDSVEQETNKIVQNQRWTEGKDNDSIYQFKQVDRWKGLQEIPNSSGG